MSITLTQDRYIDGVLTTAGSVVTTLDAATEAYLVQAGFATWVDEPFQGGGVALVRAVLNSNGGIDHFLGDDGTPYAALPLDASTPLRRTTNVKVAIFGDSTANFGTPVDPDNQNVSVCTAALATSKIIDTTRIDKSALPYLYPQARHTVHCGVSGETTTQMLARDQAVAGITRRAVTDLNNLAPDVVIFRGSINDVRALTAASTQADVTAIYTRRVQLLDRIKVGVPIIVDEGIFGYAESGTAADIAFRKAAIVTLNGLYKAYAKASDGKVVFLDLTGVLHDSTGTYLSGLYESSGVHLNNLGAYLLAEQEAALFTNLFGPSSGPVFPGSNLITNALFANTTTAGGYGPIPTGFTFGASSSTRQNAKIETVNGKLFATVEHVMTGADPYGSIYMPFAPSAMGIVANDIFGFEVDFLISTTDGSPLPVPSGRLLGQVNIAKTAAGTMTVNMCNASYTRVGYTDSQIIMHFAARIKIQEASANLNDAASNFQVQFGTAVNGTYKIGVSNPRIVGPLV